MNDPRTACNGIRNLCLAAATLLGFCMLQNSEAAVVEFRPTGEHFRDAKVYESNKPWTTVGLVGDLIQLEDGKYTFQIGTEHRYQVHIIVTVTGREVKIEEFEVHLNLSDGCASPWETRWERPEVFVRYPEQTIVISLSDVRFVRQLRGRVCALGASIGCGRAAVDISIESSPPEADIWLDGEFSGYRTPVYGLVVSFCRESPVIDVMLRKSGWIICNDTLDVQPSGKVDFACELKRP